MVESTTRQLYQCAFARVKGKEVYCAKGHKLGNRASYRALQRGDPLVISICQNCEDFKFIGKPLEKKDRGFDVT